MSGTTADGFMRLTVSASIGRTWPLFVMMSAAPTIDGSLAGTISTRSATPASRASPTVSSRISSSEAYTFPAATAQTSAPASAAITGVTTYAPLAASVSTVNPVRSSSQRVTASRISRTSRLGSSPGRRSCPMPQLQMSR